MAVPDAVLDVLADLRGMLQDTMEPPVYVSDRRLVKAIALMKVPLGRQPLGRPQKRPRGSKLLPSGPMHAGRHMVCKAACSIG